MSSRPTKSKHSKHSKPSTSKRHTSPPRQKPAEEESQEQPTPQPPPVSFVFSVDELGVNEDTDQGGESPRSNEDGFWIPPIRRNGFSASAPGRLFRWTDGTITAANECIRWGGQWWASDRTTALTPYRATTMFWCSNFAFFKVATGNASLRDMVTSTPPGNHWWPLSFRHHDALSRIEESGESPFLAGRGKPWINQFGLSAYTEDSAPTSGGLAGNLDMIIGLIAFSCCAHDLDRILLEDAAWDGYKWRGHSRRHGRIDRRGVVVTVYLDPENTETSTKNYLSPLEWEYGAILR